MAPPLSVIWPGQGARGVRNGDLNLIQARFLDLNGIVCWQMMHCGPFQGVCIASVHMQSFLLEHMHVLGSGFCNYQWGSAPPYQGISPVLKATPSEPALTSALPRSKSLVLVNIHFSAVWPCLTSSRFMDGV